MGTKRLSALPSRYGDPFYRGRGRGRGRGRREWLNERPFKRDRGFARGSSMEMEEETEGDFILRHLQKGIRETDRRRNGSYLQVLEEEVEASLFLPPQNGNHHIEFHPLLLPLRIDFSQIGVA